ncbi:hypothetical protein HON01_05045, partial [Candidatus Woesearchaeota archaeon]|nr:hypothetical protein [Candidatus Woesearchaeota archaeon]
KKLQGIKPKGIKVKDDSAFGSLVDVCNSIFDADLIIEDFMGRVNNHGTFSNIRDYSAENLNEVNFNNADLTNFIFSRINSDCDELEAKIVGMYSSALLEILTENNREKNLSTRFYINGDGNEFDYLFFGVCNFDELIVDNFKGNNICEGACSGGNTGNFLALLNLEGDNIAEGIGGGKRQILETGEYVGGLNHLVVSGCNSSRVCDYMAGGGYIGTCLFLDNKKVESVGYMAINHLGTIDSLIAYNNNFSARLFPNIGSNESYIGLSILEDNVSYDTIFSDFSQGNVKLRLFDLMVLRNNICNTLLYNSGLESRPSGKIIASGNQGFRMTVPKKTSVANDYFVRKDNDFMSVEDFDRNCVEQENRVELYDSVLSEHRIDDVMCIVKSINTDDHDDMIQKVKQIEAIRNQTKHLYKNTGMIQYSSNAFQDEKLKKEILEKFK